MRGVVAARRLPFHPALYFRFQLMLVLFTYVTVHFVDRNTKKSTEKEH